MRERPRYEYRSVIRGEERVQVAARISVMRMMRMSWKDIGAELGITASKACDILRLTDPDRIQEYLDRQEGKDASAAPE